MYVCCMEVYKDFIKMLTKSKLENVNVIRQ